MKSISIPPLDGKYYIRIYDRPLFDWSKGVEDFRFFFFKWLVLGGRLKGRLKGKKHIPFYMKV